MADETKNNQASESVPSIPVAGRASEDSATTAGTSPLRFLRGNGGTSGAGTGASAGANPANSAGTVNSANGTNTTAGSGSKNSTSGAGFSNGVRGRRNAASAPAVAVPKARRMKLSLTKVDPWSVAKVSFLLTIAVGIIQIVAVGILWMLLSQIGLFDKLNTVISQTGLASNGMDVSSFLGFGQVISWVTIFAVFEVVLVVIIATIGAFLYNVVSALVGGVHVTLGDD